MASKISGQTMYLPIVPYKVDGSSGEEFNELSVTVNFDSHRKHFYVAIHAGWKSSWGGHGCIIMGGDDPLTAPKYVEVKKSPKNSQKTINELFDNLQAAKCDIAWLFDQRDWTRLYAAVRNIALYGYTEQFRGQMKALIESTNNSKSEEDKTMKLNLSNNNETKNAAEQPVINQVDVMGLMGALNRNGRAKLSDHFIKDEEPAIEDTQAEEIESVSVGEMTLDAIQPVMVPVEGSEYQVKGDDGQEVTFESMAPNIGSEDKAVTMPLGSHGTLVIASGVPKREEKKPRGPMPKVTLKRKVTLKTKTPQPDPEAVGELAGMLTKVTLVTYTTKRGETAPRIIGFSGEDDPRWKPIYDEKQALVAAYNKAKKKDPKAKMTSSPFGPAWLTDREGSGEKQYCMTFGVRYMDVARALCEAYNTNDRDQWHKAEQAVRDQKAGIVSGYQQEREAKRAERAAKKAAETQAQAAPAAKVYTEQEVADLMQRVLKGDKDALTQVNTMLKAA